MYLSVSQPYLLCANLPRDGEICDDALAKDKDMLIDDAGVVVYDGRQRELLT